MVGIILKPCCRTQTDIYNMIESQGIYYEVVIMRYLAVLMYHLHYKGEDKICREKT